MNKTQDSDTDNIIYAIFEELFHVRNTDLRTTFMQSTPPLFCKKCALWVYVKDTTKLGLHVIVEQGCVKNSDTKHTSKSRVRIVISLSDNSIVDITFTHGLESHIFYTYNNHIPLFDFSKDTFIEYINDSIKNMHAYRLNLIHNYAYSQSDYLAMIDHKDTHE
jgi:hypothetical protein